MTSDPTAVPELLVEPSAMFPPLSGVGYYTRELLEAYSGIPGHFPIRILSFRFFLKHRTSPQQEYLAGLARRFGGEVEERRRFLPSSVYHRLRRSGRRPPFPADARDSGSPKIYFFPNYVGVPLVRAVCVPVIYDFGFLHAPDVLQAQDHLYLKRYLPRTLKRASRAVVISECTKRELHQTCGYPLDRIAVIYPGVDHAAFRPDIQPEARAAARAKYGLDGPYLFSLSTLEPRKNFAKLAEAYALLPEDIKNRIPLVVAGGRGWKNSALFDTIRKLKLETRIKFLGYIPEADRAPLMRDAELFVLPSLYEGFGMPVLEAMACGTPVVTTARGALPEVGGEAVVYTDPLDPQSIAREMEAVIGDPSLRERLSAAGPLRAAAFCWEKGARALADILKSTARNAR